MADIETEVDTLIVVVYGRHLCAYTGTSHAWMSSISDACSKKDEIDIQSVLNPQK